MFLYVIGSLSFMNTFLFLHIMAISDDLTSLVSGQMRDRLLWEQREYHFHFTLLKMITSASVIGQSTVQSHEERSANLMDQE